MRSHTSWHITQKCTCTCCTATYSWDNTDLENAWPLKLLWVELQYNPVNVASQYDLAIKCAACTATKNNSLLQSLSTHACRPRARYATPTSRARNVKHTIAQPRSVLHTHTQSPTSCSWLPILPILYLNWPSMLRLSDSPYHPLHTLLHTGATHTHTRRHSSTELWGQSDCGMKRRTLRCLADIQATSQECNPAPGQHCLALTLLLAQHMSQQSKSCFTRPGVDYCMLLALAPAPCVIPDRGRCAARPAAPRPTTIQQALPTAAAAV